MRREVPQHSPTLRVECVEPAVERTVVEFALVEKRSAVTGALAGEAPEQFVLRVVDGEHFSVLHPGVEHAVIKADAARDSPAFTEDLKGDAVDLPVLGPDGAAAAGNIVEASCALASDQVERRPESSVRNGADPAGILSFRGPKACIARIESFLFRSIEFQNRNLVT